MPGPTIASAEVSVTLDGDRIAVQARLMANQAGKAMEKEFDKHNRKIGGQFEGVFARVFRGSRNDFVNFIGVIGAGLERVLGAGVIKGFEGIGTAVSKLGDKLGGLNGPLGAVGGVLGKIGESVQGLGKGGFDGLIVQIATFALVLQSAVAIAGPIAAGISGIAGAITALAVSLGGYVIGALASLGPILLALGAGAGVALLGILGMSDAMKESLTPLQEWYETAKTIAAESLFANIGEQASGLAEILTSRLNPLLQASGDAISAWADRFLAALDSPAMQQAAAVFETELPTILTNLLDAFTGFSTGLASVMQAIAPIVSTVTGAISEAAGEFATWAASAEGQNSLTTFFQEAADTGEILWGIIQEVSGVLASLFTAGNDTGQALLQSIRDIVAEFGEWLNTEEGRAELEAWFQNAQDVASALGGVIGDLVELFAALDTPSNRQIFLVVVDAVRGLIDGLTWLTDMLESVRGYFLNFSARAEDAGNVVAGVAEWIRNAWAGIVGFFQGVWNGILNAFTTVGSALEAAWTAVQEAPGRLMDWFNNTLIPFFVSLPERLWTGFLGLVERAAALPGQIIGALANLGAMLLEFFTTAFTNATTAIGTAFTNIVTFVQQLPSMILNGLATLGAQLGAFFTTVWNNVRQWFVTGVTNAVNAARELPGKVLNAVQSLLTQLGTFITNVWNQARTFFISGISRIVAEAKQLPGKVVTAIANLGSQLYTAVTNGMGEGGRAFVNGVGNLVTEARQIPGKIANAIGDLGSTLYNAGRDLIQGLINGVKSMASSAIDSVRNLGSDMTSGIKNILGIGSPSKVFAAIGEDMIDGLVIGLDRNENRAVQTVDNIGRNLIPDWSNVSMNVGAGGSSGPVVGAAAGGNTVIVQPGAIQYVTPLADPRLVAIQSLDELVVRLG